MKTKSKPLLRIWKWQADAACRGMDSSVFFSPTGERSRARRRREDAARAICHRCPVSDPCGLFAMTSDQNFGVWGGRTEAERRSRTVAVLRPGTQPEGKEQRFMGSPGGPLPTSVERRKAEPS
ncbi:WhiB family transcriptional regulator [Streptomyces sp. NPDC058107]|uniref:WhiB family transcriptional regulator n=1 Tax=Streptomyces sp. NPDC058107 TaxID=3346343 RepID=UPI0036DFF85C